MAALGKPHPQQPEVWSAQRTWLADLATPGRCSRRAGQQRGHGEVIEAWGANAKSMQTSVSELDLHRPSGRVASELGPENSNMTRPTIAGPGVGRFANRCFKLDVELHSISLLEACMATHTAPNTASREDKPMPVSAAELVMPFLPACGEAHN